MNCQFFIVFLGFFSAPLLCKKAVCFPVLPVIDFISFILHINQENSCDHIAGVLSFILHSEF